MQTGIVYLLTGKQLAARLVVSLTSLRKWYDGPITVFTTRPESHEIGDLCSKDPHILCDHLQIEERDGEGSISAFLTKTKCMLESPYESSIFIDADTLVVGSIQELIESATESEITATVFHRWTTNRPPITEKLKEWQTLQNQTGDTFGLQQLIETAETVPFPAINVGVFSVFRNAAILPEWDQLARFAKDMPFPEEIALNLLLQKYAHRLLDTRFNCHPSVNPNMTDIRIWHYAGIAHVLDFGPRNFWAPAYQECRENNVANICQWSKLKKLEPDQRQSAAADSEA